MKWIDEVSCRRVRLQFWKREIARAITINRGWKRHFCRSIKKGGLTRDRLFKSIFRITCPMVQPGPTHSPETSVSSEIEFCGIAPRLPRKISIKFHQVRRSSATTRWQRYTPPKTRGLARSLVQSICHRLIWFADGRALPATSSICQRLGPAAFPKSRRP